MFNEHIQADNWSTINLISIYNCWVRVMRKRNVVGVTQIHTDTERAAKITRSDKMIICENIREQSWECSDIF